METTNHRIGYVPVDNLRFDPDNPRLPSTLDRGDEKAVLEWMLEDATILELMGSIGEQDYFAGEPMIVTGTDKESAYTVIEGNRRLTAVKLLRNPDLAPVRKASVRQVSKDARFKPEEVPVLVYGDRADVLEYLGYRHITGIKEWDPLAKARYLEQLRDTVLHLNEEEQFRVLAKTIGSRSDYVARLLTTLNVYQKIEESDYYDIKSTSDDPVDFSVLSTALSYSNIAGFVGLDSGRDTNLEGLGEEKLGELTSWLFEESVEGTTRVRESRDLKELSAVVSNEGALESFRNGSPLDNAVLLTGAPTETFRRAIMDARTRLQTARDYVHKIDRFSTTDAEDLLDLQRLARALKAIVDDKLLELEDPR